MADPYSHPWRAEDSHRRRDPQGVPQGSPRSTIPTSTPVTKAAEAKFKEILPGPTTFLSDPQKRRRFDAGEIDASGQEMPPRGFLSRPGGRQGRPPNTSVPAPTNPSSTWAASFPRCSAKGVVPRGFSFRGGDGEEFDMSSLPVTYSLRVPFLVAAPWRQSSGSTCLRARRSTSTSPRARPTDRRCG